ncbi:Asr1405/Asl0597 family protein [Chroogloeocystis siderophila]|jgi:hypothetical protein|uniref:Uncharacterized protein n=1 Tax=Chroogloeocystis siderophila 5.2 s.c.1 TaxID=247279 RepID=A0A1U7HXR2_9CHRO|nr:Asr1405/Asl0597 family protein [Chroogloeocystis siderophila]OKH28382.1 hypothetical protein NIES1031_03850 [Chroogloeocystis siderophila 5.2 s.c.1]
MEEVVLTSGASLNVGETVEVNGIDRWQIYQRLQELAIPCWCVTNQPLRVRVVDVTTAIQLWSVSRQFKMSRHDLVCWLERCWEQNF